MIPIKETKTTIKRKEVRDIEQSEKKDRVNLN